MPSSSAYILYTFTGARAGHMFSSHRIPTIPGLWQFSVLLKLPILFLACFGVVDVQLKLCTCTDDVGLIPRICLVFEFSQSDS